MWKNIIIKDKFDRFLEKFINIGLIITTLLIIFFVIKACNKVEIISKQEYKQLKQTK